MKRPCEITISTPAVLVVAVFDAQIIGWGGHDEINRGSRELPHPGDAVFSFEDKGGVGHDGAIL